jgi:hypothetical protein
MKRILVCTLFAVLPVVAYAQATSPATPRADKREAMQQKRIDQGVASGQLTAKESARLEKGQARIQRMEDKAKADGTVTAKERAHIQHAQGVESHRIARQKHDRQHKK